MSTCSPTKPGRHPCRSYEEVAGGGGTSGPSFPRPPRPPTPSFPLSVPPGARARHVADDSARWMTDLAVSLTPAFA
jgi:hypothetical protein